MFKIVGFYIGTEQLFNLKKDNIADFNPSLIMSFEMKHNLNFIKFWYIGNENDFKRNHQRISMSPFHDDNLYDRNILINFNKDNITIENDWLGSIPVYYNLETKEVSTYPTLVHKKNLEFDYYGLINYFDAGFCLYGHTQFKSVKFLRFLSTLTIKNDALFVEEKDDFITNINLKQTSSNEVIEKIKKYILSAENHFKNKIILPLSGGYDSRLLSSFLINSQDVLAFTYGLSKNQYNSHEVVFAKKVAEKFKFPWQQVELNNFNEFIDKWHSLFGSSTHLHGMYQIEFYDKIIKNINPSNYTVLSGIIGDAWSGKVKYQFIDKYQNLNKLTYSHGMNLDSKYFKNNNNLYCESEYIKNIHIYSHKKYQIVQRMRNKIILLNYLLSIPEHHGLIAWTPFLNYDIVMSILNLPEHEKNNRVWQTNYFKENSLLFEELGLKNSTNNSLNYDAAQSYEFELLKNNYLKNIIDKKLINKINSNINLKGGKVNNILENRLKIYKVLNKLFGVRSGYTNILFQYYTLKSIDLTLSKYE